MNIWLEFPETSQEAQLICNTQRQRAQEGFSPNNHPNNGPGFRSLNESTQFEDRLIYSE